MAPRKTDPKTELLHRQGCLHPHPEMVRDELFAGSPFFDPRDLLQVKYEMLRRVSQDGRSVRQSAAGCGLSRPSYYQARKAYEKGGLPALLPKKSGPRRAHKLTEEVVSMLREALAENPKLRAAQMAQLVEEHFGFSVHRRSIERALGGREKKRP